MTREFEQILYEGMLVAFGKVLARYDAFAQASVLRDVGRELIDYLGTHGYPFKEEGGQEDLSRMIDLFVSNGFAERLEVNPLPRGADYVWHGLYGRAAYKKLHEVSDNPFLACPLNTCLYHLAAKNHLTMRLLEKTFDGEAGAVHSQYEIVDFEDPVAGELDPLVIENARLVKVAEERANKLQLALKELKVLRGILPICMECRRIKDDAGNWRQFEAFVRDHSQADFSHGYCPDCGERVKREMAQRDPAILTPNEAKSVSNHHERATQARTP